MNVHVVLSLEPPDIRMSVWRNSSRVGPYLETVFFADGALRIHGGVYGAVAYYLWWMSALWNLQPLSSEALGESPQIDSLVLSDS